MPVSKPPKGVSCVIGVQWGDEGKGKIVDLLSAGSDYVVRYQGGGNAGHTVVVGSRKLVLHLIPAGILHPGTRCVIGNGVVVDPEQLFQEMSDLGKLGVRFNGRFFLSERAHLVFPYHKRLDRLADERMGTAKIGTTGRGIGPCYADKFARTGIRVIDCYRPRLFRQRVLANVEEKNRLLGLIDGAPPLDAEEIYRDYRRYAARLKPFVCDTIELIHQAIRSGRRILFEGAQGSLLDIDFGTYPYVTSSHSDACGVSAGIGISPKQIGTILGVAKAYTTRVGGGPFPTELPERQAVLLRERGNEFGATTGRSRRCGWFDLVASRHALEVNGVDLLAITKLDVLSGLSEIPVCVKYRYKGKLLERFPADIEVLDSVRPVYKVLPGWRENLTGVRRLTALPRAAKQYLGFLEKWLRVPIALVSVGAERGETLRLAPAQALFPSRLEGSRRPVRQPAKPACRALTHGAGR